MVRTVLADEISPDCCRLWDVQTNEKMDKDRFRRDLGNVTEAYPEVARRLGILAGEPPGGGPTSCAVSVWPCRDAVGSCPVAVSERSNEGDRHGGAQARGTRRARQGRRRRAEVARIRRRFDARVGKVIEIQLDGSKDEKRRSALKNVREAARQYRDRELPRRGESAELKAAVLALPRLQPRSATSRARAVTRVTGYAPAMARTPTRRCQPGTDLAVLPGGFAYGDYLRCGAIAARAPVMAGGQRVRRAKAASCSASATASRSSCEAGLLPGALIRNAALKFICRDVRLPRRARQLALHRRLQRGDVIRASGRPRRGQLHRRRAKPSLDELEGRRPGVVPLHLARRQAR